MRGRGGGARGEQMAGKKSGMEGRRTESWERKSAPRSLTADVSYANIASDCSPECSSQVRAELGLPVS